MNWKWTRSFIVMTFYFQPPTGFISYRKMETYALNRLKFFLRLNACKDRNEEMEVITDAQAVLWSDCLIEGTLKDRISHYLLRLTLGNSPGTKEFLCKAETAFFCLRLRNFDEYEWKKFAMTLENVLFGPNNYDDVTAGLKYLLDALKTHFGSISVMAREFASLDKCSATIAVPFQFLLNLVATRSVSLKQGMASLPVSMSIDVLAEHFHKILSTIMKQSQSVIKSILLDERIRRLESVVKRAYMYEAHPSHGIPLKFEAISLASLQTARILFPPCMSKPFEILQLSHRLHHHDRIQLTLFLKEVGLPLHEALLLWKREYSQQPCRSFPESCTHTWQGNERKYTYSIRHLYGLEGNRTQYRAHRCQSIQGRHSTSSEHGQCPFVSPDIETLSDLVSQHRVNPSTSSVTKLRDFTDSRQPGKACHWFMAQKLEALQDRKLHHPSEKALHERKLYLSSEAHGKDSESAEPHSLMSDSNRVSVSVKAVKHYQTCSLSSHDNRKRKCTQSLNRCSTHKYFKGEIDSYDCCINNNVSKEMVKVKSIRDIKIQHKCDSEHCSALRTDGFTDVFSNNYRGTNEKHIEKVHEIKPEFKVQTSNEKCDIMDQKHHHSPHHSPDGMQNSDCSSTFCSRTAKNEAVPYHQISDENKTEEDHIISVTKPSYYYWSFKSLVEGLEKCELAD